MRKGAPVSPKKTVKKIAAAKQKALSKKRPATVKPTKSAAAPIDEVGAFMASLRHPLKKEIGAVRAIVLGVDGRIAEGVKWNAPSFRIDDYFATVNLRSIDAVQLIFHRGAKSKSGERAFAIPDPKSLLKWIATDRCLVTLGAGAAFTANRKAFETIVREWVRQL